MKPLRVEFDMTREDLVAGFEAYADRDPDVRKTRGKAQRLFALAILFLTTLLTYDFAVRTPQVFTVSMSCLAGVVVLLVLRFPSRRSWREAVCRQVTSMLTTAAGQACLGPRSVEVNGDGLALASAFSRSLITWRGVINVIPTADHLVVVLPGPLCLPVPRRAFGNEHDFEHFGEVVTELATAEGGLTGRVPQG